jgi:hypothetical protein
VLLQNIPPTACTDCAAEEFIVAQKVKGMSLHSELLMFIIWSTPIHRDSGMIAVQILHSILYPRGQFQHCINFSFPSYVLRASSV